MKKTFVTKVISLLLCLCMVLPALTACSDREENVKGPVRRTEKKIQPNDPCPCGSGIKYKFCCGKKTI